jgi:MFS family permease
MRQLANVSKSRENTPSNPSHRKSANVNTQRLIEHARSRFAVFQRNARLYLLNSVLGGLSFSVYSLFFNLYILARGYPKDYLGFLAALPSMVALVAAVPMGVVSDRIGRKRSMVWGTLGALAGVVAVAWSGDAATIALGVIVMGASNELFNVSAAPFMMENSGESERTALFSTSAGLATLAGFAGSLVGGQLPRLMSRLFTLTPDSANAYAAALLASSLLMAFSLPPLLWMHEAPRRRRPVNWARPNARLLAQRLKDAWRTVRFAPVTALRGMRHRNLVVKLLLPEAVIGLGAPFLIPYMNVFFREQHHVSDEWLGLIFAISSIMTGLAMLGTPLLSRRLGLIGAVVATRVASLPFLLLLGFVPWLPVAVIGFLARGALMNMAWPLYNAFTMARVAEGERATVSALASLTNNIGWSICPYLSGLIQARWGFSPLFILTGFFYALSFTLTYWFFGRGRPSNE